MEYGIESSPEIAAPESAEFSLPEPVEPDISEPNETDLPEPVESNLSAQDETDHAGQVDSENQEQTEPTLPEPVEPGPEPSESEISEPEGTPSTWEQPNVEGVVGPEKTEIYHSPDTNPEKEPGTGQKPSFDQPPEDIPPENTVAQGMLGLAQQDENDTSPSEENQSQLTSEATASLGTGDWSLPKNVSPSEIKVTDRPDGKTSIVYGNERDNNGRIVGDHGHTVIGRDGKIDHARTQKGTVIEDTGE
jgi:hypothetical protein